MSIDQALIDRMERLVRRMSGSWSFTEDGRTFASEARGIAALFPDKDLEAARKIACAFIDDTPANVMDSGHDSSVAVQAALAGIKHGRANP